MLDGIGSGRSSQAVLIITLNGKFDSDPDTSDTCNCICGRIDLIINIEKRQKCLKKTDVFVLNISDTFKIFSTFVTLLDIYHNINLTTYCADNLWVEAPLLE